MPKKFLEPSGGPRIRYPRHSKKLSRRDEDGMEFPVGGMRKTHQFYKFQSKHTGTDYALMRRFLQSRVGRLWNDVYSEICQEADARSWPGHHLREWLDYLVEQNCTLNENGEVLDDKGHKIGWHVRDFYVHPETQILEVIQGKRHRSEKKEIPEFFLDDQQYYLHEGVWYRIKLETVPFYDNGRYPKYFFPIHDQFLGALEDEWGEKHNGRYYWTYNRLESNYGRDKDGHLRYCTWKQSANHREIEKLKKKYQI